MSFLNLCIHKNLIKILDKLGYETPTPVQNKVMPKILQGFDLRVSAPTGTGKTAAFLLPAITKLLNQPSAVKGKGPRVLILVPTRELAVQVASQAEKYSKNLNRMKTVCVYGGVSYRHQIRDLKHHSEIIVATPGRLIDLLNQKCLSLSRVEMFILDEADRMLDMGFSEPVQKIAQALPKEIQTLLFSATLKNNVQELSNKLLRNHLEINIHAEIDKKENINQNIYYVNNIQHKNKILEHLLKDTIFQQVIIFTSTKRQADKLNEELCDMNYVSAALHGDMNQRQRTRTVSQFRQEKVRILVATDVAARGIDIKNISHVINFDLPSTIEDYIHRIGRTARAGATGTAISFASNRERDFVFSIEKFLEKKFISKVIPGLEPSKKSSKKSSFNKQRFHKKFNRKITKKS